MVKFYEKCSPLSGSPYFGTYSYTNGDIYVGDLVQDLPHGNGILTENNTTKKIGVWIKGKLIEPNNALENEIIHKASHPYLRLSQSSGDATPGLDLLLSKTS